MIKFIIFIFHSLTLLLILVISRRMGYSFKHLLFGFSLLVAGSFFSLLENLPIDFLNDFLWKGFTSAGYVAIFIFFEKCWFRSPKIWHVCIMEFWYCLQLVSGFFLLISRNVSLNNDGIVENAYHLGYHVLGLFLFGFALVFFSGLYQFRRKRLDFFPIISSALLFAGYVLLTLKWGFHVENLVPGLAVLGDAGDYLILPGMLILIFFLIFRLEYFAFLQFHPLRLFVIDTNSGIPLFTYTWKGGERLANDDLFSGMVHGISLFMKESVGAGYLREVDLESATLIVSTSKDLPISGVLVTSRHSDSLNDLLVAFMEKFEEEFGTIIREGNTSDTSQFDAAALLVEKLFL